MAFLNFSYKNYMRQHRYLRDIIAVVVFSIFFGGFLTNPVRDDTIWLVFCVFALLLNLLTAPAVFFMDDSATLYFLIGKPGGRRRIFLAKVALIILIDLMWVSCFAVLYGLRFGEIAFFLGMPVRLMLLGMILTLSTLWISLAYTYRPQLTWLIFLVLIFGNIVAKQKMLDFDSPLSAIKGLSLLLPPFLELDFLAVEPVWNGWTALFAGITLLQSGILMWVSLRQMQRRDIY